jgi:bacterioferritin
VAHPYLSQSSFIVTDDNKEMLRADLKNKTETIRNYRQRIRQCEAIGEYAMAELIRGIPVNEQEHQIDLATALGIDVPRVEEPKA